MAESSIYRAMHHLRKGGLHMATGTPMDENIPADKMDAAKKSTNMHVKRMADLATRMKKFKKA